MLKTLQYRTTVLIDRKIIQSQPSGNKYFAIFTCKSVYRSSMTLPPPLPPPYPNCSTSPWPLASLEVREKTSLDVLLSQLIINIYIYKKWVRSKRCSTFISAGALTQRFPDCPASSYSLGTFWWGSRQGLTHLRAAIQDYFYKNLSTLPENYIPLLKCKVSQFQKRVAIYKKKWLIQQIYRTRDNLAAIPIKPRYQIRKIGTFLQISTNTFNCDYLPRCGDKKTFLHCTLEKHRSCAFLINWCWIQNELLVDTEGRRGRTLLIHQCASVHPNERFECTDLLQLTVRALASYQINQIKKRDYSG